MNAKVKITSMVDGFRRGGVEHSANGRIFNMSDFTKEQLEQIKAEKKLSVVFLPDEPDKTENAPKNKGKTPEKQAVTKDKKNASNEAATPAPAADGK